jgi:hypothetical protein
VKNAHKLISLFIIAAAGSAQAHDQFDYLAGLKQVNSQGESPWVLASVQDNPDAPRALRPDPRRPTQYESENAPWKANDAAVNLIRNQLAAESNLQWTNKSVFNLSEVISVHIKSAEAQGSIEKLSRYAPILSNRVPGNDTTVDTSIYDIAASMEAGPGEKHIAHGFFPGFKEPQVVSRERGQVFTYKKRVGNDLVSAEFYTRQKWRWVFRCGNIVPSGQFINWIPTTCDVNFFCKEEAPQVRYQYHTQPNGEVTAKATASATASVVINEATPQMTFVPVLLNRGETLRGTSTTVQWGGLYYQPTSTIRSFTTGCPPPCQPPQPPGCVGNPPPLQ